MNFKGVRTAIGIALVMWAGIIGLVLAISGCSADCTKIACTTPAGKTPTAATAVLPFDLKGSVTSAFQVTVDGTKYDDMEAYYTATVNSLTAKVQALGYAGYTAAFDAQLGYSDLSTGLTVYVTPATDRGYQGKTTVGSDGTFDLTLPPDAAGDTYQIKATKRISLTITNSSDVKKFCFNFSALNLQVAYSDKDKPIVLSTFQSSITVYECQVDSTLDGSLPIPPAMTTSTATGTATATIDRGVGTNTGTGTDLQTQLITVGQAVKAAEISGGSGSGN